MSDPNPTTSGETETLPTFEPYWFEIEPGMAFLVTPETRFEVAEKIVRWMEKRHDRHVSELRKRMPRRGR